MKYLVTRTTPGNYVYRSVLPNGLGGDFLGVYFRDEDAWVTVKGVSSNTLCAPEWLTPGSAALIEGDSPTNYEILKEL